MNFRAILAIVLRDLRVVGQSKAVLLPLIIVPLVIVVMLPLMVSLVPRLDGGEALRDFNELLARMPPSFQANMAGYDHLQSIVVLVLVYMFAPFYLILPLMVSSVIAADSFAGEKERKTLEALLYTPTSDLELLLAKLLAAWLPGVVLGWVSFALYAVVANLVARPILAEPILPNAMWLILVFWVAPAVAAMGMGVTVLVSSRVNSFQEAYQMGSLVVLPIIALLIAQFSGVIYLNTLLVALMGLLIWAFDLILVFYGAKSFRRSELITRL